MKEMIVTTTTGDICDDDHLAVSIAPSVSQWPGDWRWLAPYFALIGARPEIKWFHYVNYDWTKASYYLSQGWKNNDLSANSTVAASYLAELGKAKYLHAGEKGLLKDYGKYQ